MKRLLSDFSPPIFVLPKGGAASESSMSAEASAVKASHENAGKKE
jgi:hypothetical protein